MDAEKAAIYHFTDGSEARPIVVRKEINRIMDFACKAGFHETDVFLDTSLRKCRQVKRLWTMKLQENWESPETSCSSGSLSLR